MSILPALFLFPALLTSPAHAQLFGPESMGGAVLGGIAGGVIGHNNGRRNAEGAAIGAGAGALLGAIVGSERRAAASDNWNSAPPPHHPHQRAVTGAVVGGIAGGIIGHNQGRHTAEGIAIGAGAGLLLGSLADRQAAQRQAAWQQPPQYAVATPQSPVPTPTTEPAASEPILIRPVGGYPGTHPMAGANSLFGR